MATDPISATEAEQHAKTHRYLEDIYKEVFAVRRQQAAIQHELKQPSRERGQRKWGETETAAGAPRPQLSTFFADVEVEAVEPRETSSATSASSRVPVVGAVVTGVLGVVVLLLPSGSYWLMAAAAALWVAALTSGALAIRYDRGLSSRGV